MLCFGTEIVTLRVDGILVRAEGGLFSVDSFESDDLDQIKSEIERCISLSTINMQLAAPAFPLESRTLVEADTTSARFIVVMDDDFRLPRVAESLFQHRYYLFHRSAFSLYVFSLQRRCVRDI